MANPNSVNYQPASRLVREYARKHTPRCHVFNDRLKDGGRSIKVWGKNKKFYMPIKRKLEQLGYTVTLVNLGKGQWNPGNQDCYRIHVG